MEKKQLMFKVSSDGELISLPIKLWEPTNLVMAFQINLAVKGVKSIHQKTFKRFILVIQSADISEQKELMFNEFET
mgnify:FL=1